MANQSSFPWPTEGGYDYYEVLSAFQKSIRRGLEEDALFWGIELDRSGYTDHLWNRMKVIASEDIGVANSDAAIQIRTLWENSQDTPEPRLYIVHAILILVRSPKSRIVDNALHYFYDQKLEKQIPDYALDKHTRKGKMMGRGLTHFLKEGAKLENKTLDDAYEGKWPEVKHGG